jgi:hypothetical protein
MTTEPETLRSVIDEIALQVAEVTEHEGLEEAIGERTVAYMTRRFQRGVMSEAEVDRVIKAIIAGVLERLEQIALGGRQIGSA